MSILGFLTAKERGRHTVVPSPMARSPMVAKHRGCTAGNRNYLLYHRHAS